MSGPVSQQGPELRTPIVACVVVAVALFVIDALAGGDDDAATPRAAATTPVGTIARRVERLRDLHFSALPRPVTVRPAQARAEGLEDFDRATPADARRADELLLESLGLVEAPADLRAAAAALFEQQVAGYYDPRDGRLRVVAGASTGGPALREATLAHELTHALEDQVFGIDTERAERGDDAALAYQALVEGTATTVMTAYQARFADPGDALAESLGSLLGSSGGTDAIPPFLLRRQLFPYLGGQAFVAELLRAAQGDWTLVDAALRTRPPVSTEQVLHPLAYLRFEDPVVVRLHARRALGAPWRRASGGVLGEWATRELSGDRAAAGWGGDAYELWRSRPLSDRACAATCTAVVVRWVADSARDRDELLRALRGAPGVVAARGRRGVALAVAADPALAAALAREA